MANTNWEKINGLCKYSYVVGNVGRFIANYYPLINASKIQKNDLGGYGILDGSHQKNTKKIKNRAFNSVAYQNPCSCNLGFGSYKTVF